MCAQVVLLRNLPPFIIRDYQDLNDKRADVHLQTGLLLGDLLVNEDTVDQLVKDVLAVNEF